MEVWKDIDETKGRYQVSNLGRVRRTETGAIRRPNLLKCGYYYVTLFIDGKLKGFRIHRLVGKAFVENPNNAPEVNHIDCIKTNNRAENLEWCTRKENMEHASENGLMKAQKMITHHRVVIDTATGKEYYSVREAARALNVGHHMLHARLKRNSPKNTLQYKAA